MKPQTPHYMYDGNWVQGFKSGRGVCKNFTKGIEYDGTWRNDKYDGMGVLKTKDIVYTGHFTDGLKEGKGIEINQKKKTRFVGMFVAGERMNGFTFDVM